MNANKHQLFLTLMAVYWLVFGLITTFYPKLMDLFQTDAGINAKTPFSDHVWFHGGLDIIALVVVLLALSRVTTVSSTVLRAVAVAALMPTIAIAWSLIATPFWNPLFIGAGLGTLAFAVWGFVLSGKVANSAV